MNKVESKDFLNWLNASITLKNVKAKEADLRRSICGTLAEGEKMEKGRLTVKTIMEGFKVKAIKTLGYRVDKDMIKLMWKDMSEEEKAAIRWVPELALREYKALPDDSILHEAITTYDAMPTLEAVPE